MSASASTQKNKQRIAKLLESLPPESLTAVEQFVRSLRHTQTDEPRYPTVSAPVASLNAWLNLLAEGYTGDALADTEALYTEN